MKLAFWVLGVHLVVVIVAALTPSQRQEEKKKLLLRTRYVEAPPQPTVQASLQPPSTPSSSQPKKREVKKKAPPSKKEVKPLPSRQKVKTKSAPTKRESPKASSVPRHLLQELEKTLARMDEKRAVEPSFQQKSVVKYIEPLESEKFYQERLEVGDPAYHEQLVRYLRDLLYLPDFGEVKLELTLLQDGSVKQMRVMQAQSEKNRRYLEEALPLLKFPVQQGASEKNENTFILTFCNE